MQIFAKFTSIMKKPDISFFALPAVMLFLFYMVFFVIPEIDKLSLFHDALFYDPFFNKKITIFIIMQALGCVCLFFSAISTVRGAKALWENADVEFYDPESSDTKKIIHHISRKENA